MPKQIYTIQGKQYEIDPAELDDNEKARLLQLTDEDPASYFQAPKLPGPKTPAMQEDKVASMVMGAPEAANALYKKALTVPFNMSSGMAGGRVAQEGDGRVMSHLLGAATGATGGPVGAVAGGIAGADNLSEALINLVGGPLAKGGAKIVQNAGGMKGTMAGLLGLGQHEVNTAIHNATNPTAPQSSLLQRPAGGGQETVVTQGLSALLPMLGANVEKGVNALKYVKGKKVLEGLRGKGAPGTDPRQAAINTLPVEQHLGKMQDRVAQVNAKKMAQAGEPINQVNEQLTAARHSMRDVNKELRSRNESQKLAKEEKSRVSANILSKIEEHKRSIELTKKRNFREQDITEAPTAYKAAKEADEAARQYDIDILEEEISELRKQNLAVKGKNPSNIQTGVDTSSFNAEKYRRNAEQMALLNKDKERIKGEIDVLNQNFKDISATIKPDIVLSQNMRNFANAKNAEDFLGQIRKGTHEQLGELLHALTPKQKNNLRETVLNDFSRLAFGSGKPDASKISEFYSPEKVASLYGRGPAATEAALRIKNATEAISQMSGHSVWTKLGEYIPSKAVSIVGGYLAFHPKITPGLITGAAAAGLTLGIPKLLNAIATNRKFGDQFIEAASTGQLTKGALESFPLVREFIKDNGEPLSGKEKSKLSTTVDSLKDRKTP